MKQYVKPELFYENFELAQHIAACGYDLNHGDVFTCKIEMDNALGGTAEGGFADTRVCDFEYEDYCTTNGSGGFAQIFTS